MDKKALLHFKKVDPILYKIALDLKVEKKVKPHSNEYFVELIDTIVSQQLSGKAAATIFSRLKNLMPTGQINPKNLVKINEEKMRSAGISYAKIRYIKGIAQEVDTNRLDLSKFDKESDEKIREELIKLKGIGPWSIEMFLMFSMNREDIFSTKDLGLKNAIKRIYGLKKDPTEKELLKISSKWSPHRTYASRVLWGSLS